MKIYIGADHGGFDHKEVIKTYLQELSFDVMDLGNNVLEKEDDYTDFASLVAKEISKDPDSRGILICRSGVGMCIAANKYKGVRAVLGLQADITMRSRKDEDTNILCLAGDYTSQEDMKHIIDVWLNTPFSNEVRHQRRLKKIHSIENI